MAPGKAVLLRTELDALPVTEETGLPYASNVRATDASGKEVGVMHACGHDVHMAAWLGTARIMANDRSRWSAEPKLFAAAHWPERVACSQRNRPLEISGIHVSSVPSINFISRASPPLLNGVWEIWIRARKEDNNALSKKSNRSHWFPDPERDLTLLVRSKYRFSFGRSSLGESSGSAPLRAVSLLCRLLPIRNRETRLSSLNDVLENNACAWHSS